MNLVKRPRIRSNSSAGKLIGAIITIGLIGMAFQGQADAATPATPNAPLAVVTANAYAARLLSVDEQAAWLRALHGADLPVVCRTFNADTPDTFSVCAPYVDNDNSPIVGGVEEDGAARYADGSEYDPSTATWN